jgi:transcriptional regulator of nitric oxide reductase
MISDCFAWLRLGALWCIAVSCLAVLEPVSIGAAEGNPPSAAVRAADGRTLAFAFSTHEVAGSVGYSGRPIDIVAAVTPEGTLAGAKIVAHEEPILVIGVPREALAAYVANFKNFDVRSAAAVRGAKGPLAGPQAVAGATVTSAVIRDAIVRSARAVLRARSPQTGGRPRLDRETLRTMSWSELVEQGALRHLMMPRGEAARLLASTDPEPDKLFIDLWLALATPPPIGESLVGKPEYQAFLARIGPDDDLVLIAANGLYSFKGTEWRRSGVFDRIEIIQGSAAVSFRADDHLRIDLLRASGAPEFREIGLFRIPHATGFDPTAPFRLELAIGRDAGLQRSAVVPLDYQIPTEYLVRTGALAVNGSDLSQAPLWVDIWHSRRLEIALLGLMLVSLAAVLVFQDFVTARARFYHRLRTGYLVFTLVFLGFVANAQLSVVNVVTFVHALLSGFRWELFLLDPMVFLLWSFVAVSMLFWGRGVFCGWLCPFGALQELLNMLARRFGLKQVEVPFELHQRLWMIKYVIFLGILAVSLSSVIAAFELAEAEPFKTAITLKFMRDWPFVVYAGLLLLAGLFIERLFCRYICPLGGALAIPARIRMFEWLKRRRECGNECQICARHCTVQAIHPLGNINPNECIYCLGCQANYFDPNVCPPLRKREERRQLREAAILSAAKARQP